MVISLDKKYFILITLGIILFGANVLAIPNPGHSANEILIEINKYSMTLQEAVDNLFIQDYDIQPTQEGTTNLLKSHSGENIKIYLDEQITLQEALNNKISFCKNNNPVFNWVSLFFGHNSDNIEIIINNQATNFQDAINSGKLCPPYTYAWKELGDWTTCTVNCGGGTQTQTVICERSDGTPVEEENCNPTTKPLTTKICNTQACPTCTDGIRNQGETGVDVGGPCPPFPQRVTSGGYTFTCDGLWRHLYANRWYCLYPKVYSGSTYGSVWGGTKTQDRANTRAWCSAFGAIYPGDWYASNPGGPNDVNNKRAIFNGNTWVINTFTYRSVSIDCST